MRRLLLSLAAVAVATAVVVTIAAQPRPQPQESKKDDVHVTDEMLRHTRLRHTLYFVGVAYSSGVLLLVLFSGLSRRMRDAAARDRPVGELDGVELVLGRRGSAA